MNKRKKLFLKVLTLILMSVMMLSAQPAMALSDYLKEKFSDYQIYFYNPEQCTPGTTVPGGPEPEPEPNPDAEKWDGSCSSMNADRIEWVNNYLSPMQTVASRNGLPWEMIPAQVFQESGGGKKEACDNNPLGLKANSSYVAAGKYCNVDLGGGGIAKFAKFDTYEDAFQYYADTAAISKVKNKYPNNPYGAVAYMQSGNPPYYAVCDSEKYSQCVGYMGEPTPGYVNTVSSLICGIQKWAKSQGISISTVTWENYGSGGGSGSGGSSGGGGSGGSSSGAVYCNENGPTKPDPDPSGLAGYVTAWAWPTFRGYGFTERKPAYANYIDTQATYKGGACADGTRGIDCGVFVANIIKASGWDTSYVQGSTSTQATWLESHWNKVSASSLKLGDVGIRPGHVILYIGDISGFSSKTVSASLCGGEHQHSPMATNDNVNNYTWYRKK